MSLQSNINELELLSRRDFVKSAGSLVAAPFVSYILGGCAHPQASNSNRVLEPLKYLSELSTVPRYSYQEFFDEFRKKLETEEISAVIFGEQHWIHSKNDLVYKIMEIVMDSSRTFWGFRSL